MIGQVSKRLAAGQCFNTYEAALSGDWIIGIGPVSDFLGFARCHAQDVAEEIVDALRVAHGQAPAVSRESAPWNKRRVS